MQAILVIVPLFPKFPLIGITGTYVAIRAEDILLLALAILVFIKVLSNLKNFLKDEIVIAFLIFFGTGFVSLLAGSFLTQTVSFRLGIFHWLRRIEYAIPFFAGLTLLAKEKVSENLNFYIKTLLIVVLIVFLYGWGQIHFGFPVIITQNEEYSKGVALLYTAGSQLNSTFAGHYDLASFCVLLLPRSLSLVFLLRDRLSKLFLLVGSGMGLWLLITTFSRTAQVAYLVGISITFLLIRKFKAAIVVIVISAIFIGLSAGVQMRFSRLFESFQKKLTSNSFQVMAAETVISVPVATPHVLAPTPVPIFEDRSTSIRLNVEWPRAMRAFVKDPIIGTGYSSIDLATDNDYLRMLGETGILGFAAFLAYFCKNWQAYH